MPAIVVAIDGPAASGKGTLARRLAERFGFAHLDTGALYRAVGLKLARAGIDAEADAAMATQVAIELAETLTAAEMAVLQDDPALREGPAGEAASRVAAIPAVRTALLQLQRDFAAHPPHGAPGAVLDGRDVGTVVCPDAQVKLFVTADVAVRARRRHLELIARGEASIEDAVLADMQRRDARDTARAVAPLRPAEDAAIIDSSALDVDAAMQRAVEAVNAALSRQRPEEG